MIIRVRPVLNCLKVHDHVMNYTIFHDLDHNTPKLGICEHDCKFAHDDN